ncbi:hypothetical protein GEMRC1_009038 [Eukaryota sp. GEM-RC1]
MFSAINHSDQSPEEQVDERRQLLGSTVSYSDVSQIPHSDFDYSAIQGRCCENVVGYVPIPLGIAGPLVVNNFNSFVPLATTEGCLVASVQRGIKAISESGGSSATVLDSGMTRAPLLKFPSLSDINRFLAWLTPSGFSVLSLATASSSRYAKLIDLKPFVAGRFVFLRIKISTGDAMGMNMVSKASKAIVDVILRHHPSAQCLSLSGNVCTDKKHSSINWVLGRGKSVIAEAVLSADTVNRILKTTPKKMVDLNIAKNLVGSAVAGSVGGFNAHAANVVAAIFASCGQDIAQVVESSQCMTLMEVDDDGNLYASVTMPSVEMGVVGGGTELKAQSQNIKLMIGDDSDCNRVDRVAMVLASAVLAGELSLMAALVQDELVSAHMKFNRKQIED